MEVKQGVVLVVSVDVLTHCLDPLIVYLIENIVCLILLELNRVPNQQINIIQE